MSAITQWDFSVLDAIAARRTPFFDAIFPFITKLGNAGVVWILFAAVLLCFKKTRRLAICAAIALILDLLVCNFLLKPMVDRVRPFALREVQLLVPAPGDASFPSGHAAAAFSFSMALAFRKSKLAIPALLLAALISFTRLYFYLHFPTDVLGGIAVGIVCAAAACFLEAKLSKKLRLPHSDHQEN